MLANPHPPSIQRLARQLLAIEAAGPRPADSPAQFAAIPVFEKLTKALMRNFGLDGTAALLRRALTVARADTAVVNSVTLMPDGSLDGLQALALLPDGGTEAATIIISNLLGLLVTFVGEPLMQRVVREAWPDITIGN